ncbi:TIGR03936 family radical SAM-associated protein [Actinokineospora sp. UTMC 2448]|uniref:TIGR03936 family radical SAM-associated protein n=1 Tax=Actinokineospora sp. UTMC 2448 TaxID=2268449 RepID=UPI002164561F|nr:TIGR03936 family radical SAM-associated protein [Actinokineospora sp. UTMC 2448]
MQKLRVRYAKRGRLRFTSHRDVARAFERALRRAGVPMAYSQGFSPHPKISWIGAAPTGVASEAEYVEVQLVAAVDPSALARALDEALPPGLDVLDVVAAGPGSLADRVDAAEWLVEMPGVSSDTLRAAVDRLLAEEHVMVSRRTKDGTREIDVRPAVILAEVADPADGRPAVGIDMPAGDGPCGILRMVVRQTTPAVRPDDVLSALRVVAALDQPVPAKATRLAQGRLDDVGALSDPLAPDRAASAG